MRIEARSFADAFVRLDHSFLMATRVHTERWQGKNISRAPEMRSHEVLNMSLEVPLNGIEDLDIWQLEIGPNIPWADDHFDERVCGEPLNPAMSYKHWPWAASAEKFVNDSGQFNHTYPERLWPKYAGMTDKGELGETLCDEHFVDYANNAMCASGDPSYLPMNKTLPHRGIRWSYGDLGDLVKLLANEPLTRQAWIPLFFPEDTGLGDGGRKPCTLGYQFIMRENQLHMYYPLRSCDYVRHFRDDIYLAIRLLLWVLNECRKINPTVWDKVRPGVYTMHATSLHIFANDYHQLKARL